MSGFEKLVVVSSAGWLARDFDAPAIVPVIPEIGFDLPRLDPKTTAWWCSGSYAARAAATGLVLPLMSAGPHWLNKLPHQWRQRAVTSLRVSDVPNVFSGGFIKPAEIKVGLLNARVYKGTDTLSPADEFLEDVEIAGLPADSWLTLSEPMNYVREYRCFTVKGKVTATSPYLLDGVTWDGMEPDADPEGCNAAAVFVEALLEHLGPEGHPPGFVVDAGVDDRGDWSIIEANASWSSNPYHADMAGVIESVFAAHDVDGKYPQWAWQIDPYHQKNARKLYWKEPK